MYVRCSLAENRKLWTFLVIYWYEVFSWYAYNYVYVNNYIYMSVRRSLAENRVIFLLGRACTNWLGAFRGRSLLVMAGNLHSQVAQKQFGTSVVEEAKYVVVVRWQQDENGKEAREEIGENPVGFTGEGKRWKGNMRKVHRK